MKEEEIQNKHKRLVDIQQSEARNHWNRNNVFLIVSSILLLALTSFTTVSIQLFISSGAILINICWLLVQWRSSSYIKAWKDEAKKLEKEGNIANIFSKKVSGIEMRIIAFFLPITFIIIWIAIIVILSINI